MEQNTATPQPVQPASTEPDRIAALDQQMADRIAYLEERAAETIHALEQRVAELEERLRPSAEPPEGISSRQVAQITGGDNWLVALCNDGTLLQLAKGTWTELPAIPQP